MKWPVKCFFALLASNCLNSWAESPPSQVESAYDRFWAGAVLYDNDDNPGIQSFSLIGRYHGQYWSVDADQGDASDYENRRRIVGFSSKWFEHFTVQAQMYFKTSGSVYDHLYEAFIKYSSPATDFSISAGRLDYLFTGYERSTSSKKINTIERGLLVNQIMPAEVVGAHMTGGLGRFTYQAGVFSRSIEDEFDDFDTGAAAVIGGGFELPLFFEGGDLHLDYLYNSRDTEGNAFKPYRHVLSLWHRGERGRFAVGTDLTMAEPLETDGHVWGLTLEPSWMLTEGLLGKNDALQLVARYQYATSTMDNGLLLQRRYEQKVTAGEGDDYQAVYAGVNYYLYGHRLKLMFGGEYARMRDAADDGGAYKGWTWSGAFRIYF
jgi:phosphate-selective porin OprO/OprP